MLRMKRCSEKGVRSAQKMRARKVSGRPKTCELAHAFRWEYNDKGPKLAQLLGQRGARLARSTDMRRGSLSDRPDALALQHGAARGTVRVEKTGPAPSTEMSVSQPSSLKVATTIRSAPQQRSAAGGRPTVGDCHQITKSGDAMESA